MTGQLREASAWIDGVDASYAELTPAIADALLSQGVCVWWQCLWTGVERPEFAVPNLRIAHERGLAIAGYCSVTSRNPGWWHANHARDGVDDDLWAELRVVACDVELPGIPDETIRQCVDALFDLGKRRAIYTSYGHWTSSQGDSRAFTDCLLCNALWDGDPDVDFAALPYGGWTVAQVLLEQFTGGTYVEGILIDRDTWNRELLTAETTEGDVIDAPTKGEFQAMYRLVDAHYRITLALATAFGDLASHVYGDNDPKIAQLRATVSELNTRAAIAAAALPEMETG